MKQRIFFLLFMYMVGITAYAQNPPKREFRAAWLVTYANIDWPSSGSTSAQEQSTFIQRVDEHKATGMNALFVQVRSQCDAMYPSAFEPWSADLTGTQGTGPNPYYDPLEFMIGETKKRGMEFHAWFNPYRALANASTANLAALHSSHVINQHPEWIMSAGTQRILNPGIPAVWEYVTKIIMDVVRRYDIDGVHFDDYFYPYPSAGTYNDDNEYSLYNRGIATKAEWRRSNVDTLIRRLNDSIKLAKPWVKFGVSPSGIWLSQANDAVNGSNTSSGAIQHYKDLYANSRLWMQQGWIDYLAPQIYWYIGQSGSDYNILVPWWNNNAFGRHIYSGMAGYKVGDVAQNASFATDNSQIPNQVKLNRQYANIKGQAIYNTTSLRNNKLGFRDSLKLNFFNKPALQPTMSWNDNTPPLPATFLIAAPNGTNSINLSWTNPPTTPNELDKAKRFAIYRSTNSVVDISNSSNLIAITWNDTTRYADNAIQSGTTYYYVVTALDRFQNESTASNTATATTLPLNLLHFSLNQKIANTVDLKWATEKEINVDHFEVEKATANSPFTFVKNIAAKNSAGINDYFFQDDIGNTKGTLYYRLKIVDKDGSFAYSKILNLTLYSATNSIKVFPTIIAKGDKLNIAVKGAATQMLTYKIIDVAGRIVDQGNATTANNLAVVKPSINSGFYYLHIICQDGLQHQTSIIIQ